MAHSPLARRSGFVLAALALAGSSVFLATAPGTGALSATSTPEASPVPPNPNSSITMTAEPLLGRNVRSGTWAAVRVRLENHGPQVDGELRISTSAQGASTYGVPIQLAPGARQEHILYGKTASFESRFLITLVSGGSEIVRANAPIDASEPETDGVYVIAEHPEALVTSIRGAISSPGRPPPAVVAIGAADLPARVEAWGSVDRLVWQDINSANLDGGQLEALRTWVSSGGQLVILGGTTGTTTLGGFPSDLLPYQAARVIDVPTADLQLLLGTLPAEATALPALAGTLDRGTVIARSGDDVIAAGTIYGQGSVALFGIDPSTPWLAGSSAADVFWARALPPSAVRTELGQARGDDFILSALNNLPSVQLPRMDQLFLLIVAYIIAIGPLNYVVLRHRDRREWAWLTMPAVILFFAVAAYGFGVLLKGTNVIVNELAIVYGSAGTDRGIAEVHVGVFSPNRATFDVKVGGNALLSAPPRNPFEGGEERPLDVLFGDPATLRGYSVGFGVLRGFRAEASVSTPRMEADLRLVGDALEGTITNVSDLPLEHVSLVYGNGVQVLGAMAPGEARPIGLEVLGSDFFSERLADRIFVRADSNDAEAARTLVARRAIIQHLAGGWNMNTGEFVAGSLGNGAVILAWRSGGTLDIDVGTPAERVGETLFVLPARATVTGPVVFAGGLIHYDIVESDAIEVFDEGFAFTMGYGTMTVEYRPVGFEGAFDVTGLLLRVNQGEVDSPAADGEDLPPLPAEEQPDSDDPLASEPRPDEGAFDVPRVQLFDRVAGTWIEFEPVTMSRTYRITDPERYVDSSGGLRVRFVLRDTEAYSNFSLAVRLEGDVR
ncbi:MAG: hypothetical protein WD830_05075 [Chloroflexota bacterium]